jgi:hypothetical protein
VELDTFIDGSDSRRQTQDFIGDGLVQIHPCYRIYRVIGKIRESDIVAAYGTSTAVVIPYVVNSICAGMVIVFKDQRKP